MSKMDYYSNELEDDFIEIDDTISNKEYHSSEVKEKKEEDKTPYYDWRKYAVTSCQPANLYADPWQPINQIDAQQCNAYRQDLRTLANACQTQQVITNPLNLLIQQQLNANCQDLEASLIRIKHLKEKYS